jgi:hypothetical protein
MQSKKENTPNQYIPPKNPDGEFTTYQYQSLIEQPAHYESIASNNADQIYSPVAPPRKMI